MTREEQAIQLHLDGWSYGAIGLRLGISRQRAYQLVRAPKAIRKLIADRAQGKCEECGINLPNGRGDTHHVSKCNASAWNEIENMRYLCVSCHMHQHKCDAGLKSVRWERHRQTGSTAK